MKRPMIIALVVFALVAGSNLTMVMMSDPMEAVRAAAVDHGWTPEDLVPLEGGYESSWLSMRAHGSYTSKAPDRSGELTVVVEKSSPFHSWRLVQFSFTPTPSKGAAGGG